MLQGAGSGAASHGRAPTPDEPDTGFADEGNMPKLALPDLDLGARCSPTAVSHVSGGNPRRKVYATGMVYFQPHSPHPHTEQPHVSQQALQK